MSDEQDDFADFATESMVKSNPELAALVEPFMAPILNAMLNDALRKCDHEVDSEESLQIISEIRTIRKAFRKIGKSPSNPRVLRKKRRGNVAVAVQPVPTP